MNDQGTNGNNCAIPVPSFVYFARVGRMIKIGYSANVSVRMYYLRCQTGQDHEVIFQIPGGLKTERKLHRLFHSEHVAGELFRPERVEQFIARARADLKDAWNWLDAISPGKDGRRRLSRREEEAELDALCARLVVERKQLEREPRMQKPLEKRTVQGRAIEKWIRDHAHLISEEDRRVAHYAMLSADTFIGNKNSHLLSARFKQRYIDQIDAFDVLRKNVDERAQAHG